MYHRNRRWLTHDPEDMLITAKSKFFRQSAGEPAKGENIIKEGYLHVLETVVSERNCTA